MTVFSLFYKIFESTSYACAVCGFGQDGSQFGFLLTTAILTLVPLGLMLGFVLFLRHRHNSISRENALAPGEKDNNE